MTTPTYQNWNQLSQEQRSRLLQRPAQQAKQQLSQQVAAIIAAVRSEGQRAVDRFTRSFDKVEPVPVYQAADLQAAGDDPCMTPEVKAAMERAYEQISGFHRQGIPKGYAYTSPSGVECWLRVVPIQRVGLYVPGGGAPLPSTVFMLGIPAALAGCPVKVLATPPGKDGRVHPSILYAAHLCGVEKVYPMGGAQAVAAMAFGTETVPAVDKIYGPGNSWVTEAKLQVAAEPDGAACDLPAGPSEVMVVADGSADPCFAAADLLSQAEHGPDSQVILVAESADFIAAVQEQLVKQLKDLSRSEVCQESLQHARYIVADSRDAALEVVNSYAPEHLIVQRQDAAEFADGVVHAGSIFLGHLTPESLGDYASGTNHVLPTYGYARAYSGLSVAGFCKHITVQQAGRRDLQEIGPTVMTLAELEGLDAHAAAVRLRLAAMETDG